MKYVVEIDGREHEVALDGSKARVGGAEADVHVIDLEGTPVRLVSIAGRVYRVLAKRGSGAGQYTIHLGGFRFDVEALDERSRAIRQLARQAARPSGPAALTAPMPGLVVRVLVQVGDAVQSGQGVVVIEAMKMENELRAPAPGLVRRVVSAPGSAVEKGALLVEFDPAP